MTKPAYDIADETLDILREISPTPELLDEIVSLSRDQFGWYTRQFLRGLEFPWVVSNIDESVDYPACTSGLNLTV